MTITEDEAMQTAVNFLSSRRKMVSWDSHDNGRVTLVEIPSL